jgi:2-keto-4-pentenoate hydratase/2-oxohepta-3-ene-1,7-dioic acid hydratase in catechol pathway
MKLQRALIDQRLHFLRSDGEAVFAAECPVFPFPQDALTYGDFHEYTGEFESVPVVSPSKIVCVGRNYSEHANELGNAIPSSPLLFLKAPSSIIQEGDSIRLPEQSSRVEHEGELGIVIGRRCCQMRDDQDPLDYVFGYTCVNDVTARDLQKADVQFTRGKSFDSFCPVGPVIETDLDISDIGVAVSVNGEVKQSGRTSQMVFDIPFLLRYISMQMTLLPGDLIATGTPGGVSGLQHGDLCEVSIEGIGTLQNPVTDQHYSRRL